MIQIRRNHSLTPEGSETGAYSPKYLSITDRIPLKTDRFDGESLVWYPVEYSSVPNTSRRGHWGHNYVFLTISIFAGHCINQKPCESRDLLRVRTTLSCVSGSSRPPLTMIEVFDAISTSMFSKELDYLIPDFNL